MQKLVYQKKFNFPFEKTYKNHLFSYIQGRKCKICIVNFKIKKKDVLFEKTNLVKTNKKHLTLRENLLKL